MFFDVLRGHSIAVSICTRFLKYRVWKIKFDELDFLSISNSNFAGYTGSKNLVQTRQKFQFIKLDFSISIFQNPSADRYCESVRVLVNMKFFNLDIAKKLKTTTFFWRLFFYQTHLRLPLPLIKLRYGSVWPQGDLTHFVVQYNVDPAPTHLQKTLWTYKSLPKVYKGLKKVLLKSKKVCKKVLLKSKKVC